MLYCSGSWNLNKNEESKLDAVETRFLRRVSDHTLFVKKRKADIRKGLSILKLTEMLHQYETSWIENIESMKG